jgi:hypothetical protein
MDDEERWSSYIINPYYRRIIPPSEPQGPWVVWDLLGFLWLVGMLALLFKGLITWTMVGRLYCLVVWTISLNYVRNLTAHRYVNGGRRMTYEEQIEDSLTIGERSILTLFLFPVGLRYHTLHARFPIDAVSFYGRGPSPFNGGTAQGLGIQEHDRAWLLDCDPRAAARRKTGRKGRTQSDAGLALPGNGDESAIRPASVDAACLLQ